MEAYQDYNASAYAILNFVCRDCGASIEPPEWYQDCDEEYCYYIARRAESAGWFIACDEHITCYCPSCRETVVKVFVPNHRAGADAGFAVVFSFGHHSPDTAQHER